MAAMPIPTKGSEGEAGDTSEGNQFSENLARSSKDDTSVSGSC
jgi:hypothetical protein